MNDLNEYRFYHCYQKPLSVDCHLVDNASIEPSEPNSRLLFVSKDVPEVLDTLVLKYYAGGGVQIMKMDNKSS